VALLITPVAGSPRTRQWFLIGCVTRLLRWWDVRFVILPVSQVTITGFSRSSTSAAAGAHRSSLALCSICFHLGRLNIFNFVLGLSGRRAASHCRGKYHSTHRDQFFTFQLISYLVDRMRGQAPIYPFRPFRCSSSLSAPHRRPDRPPQRVGAAIWRSIRVARACGGGSGWGFSSSPSASASRSCLPTRSAPCRPAVAKAAFACAQSRSSLESRCLPSRSSCFSILRLHRNGDRLGADLRLDLAGELPPPMSHRTSAISGGAGIYRLSNSCATTSTFRCGSRPRAMVLRGRGPWSPGLCGLWHGAG